MSVAPPPARAARRWPPLLGVMCRTDERTVRGSDLPVITLGAPGGVMSERSGGRSSGSSPGPSAVPAGSRRRLGGRSRIASRCVFAAAGLLAAACGSGDGGSASTSNADPVEVLATDAPSSPPTQGTVDPAPVGEQPQGFTTIMARVTAADGEVCEVCLWLADTAEERGRGLMGVTDLGPAGGHGVPVRSGDDRLVLHVPDAHAAVDRVVRAPTVTWVGSAEMEPCLDDDPAACALYSPNGAVLHGRRRGVRGRPRRVPDRRGIGRSSSSRAPNNWSVRPPSRHGHSRS